MISLLHLGYSKTRIAVRTIKLQQTCAGNLLAPSRQTSSDGCGHCILASARKHLDALLCTNMRTVSGVSGSDSVFAEDSSLQWRGAVTLSVCSPTFRPIFREYSTTQRRTQIRLQSSSGCHKVTHFPY